MRVSFDSDCAQSHGPYPLFALLLSQFKSPLALILFFATGLSFFLGNAVDASIILVIVLANGLLGFWQERGASNAVESLLSIVRIKADALSEGRVQEVPVEEIVPGDIVILSAGDIVPGDSLLQDSKDLFVDEAIMTGETIPVVKAVGDETLAEMVGTTRSRITVFMNKFRKLGMIESTGKGEITLREELMTDVVLHD